MTSKAWVRILVVASVMTTILALGVPASADHDHVRLLGNGKCVILAEKGNEKDVELPFAGEHPEGRRHPLHVNVHLGEPGTRGGQAVVWVKDTPEADANCDGFVNG